MGPYSIWYIFTAKRFEWGSVENGVFLAGYGVAAVISQGFLLPRLTPAILSEHGVVILGFSANALVFASYGALTKEKSWAAFALLPLCMLGAMTEPVMRHVFTQLVGGQGQGALQGMLASLSTIGKVEE